MVTRKGLEKANVAVAGKAKQFHKVACEISLDK